MFAVWRLLWTSWPPSSRWFPWVWWKLFCRLLCGRHLGAYGRLLCDLFRRGFPGFDGRLLGSLLLRRNFRRGLFLAVSCHDASLLEGNRVTGFADTIYMPSNDLAFKSLKTKWQAISSIEVLVDCCIDVTGSPESPRPSSAAPGISRNGPHRGTMVSSSHRKNLPVSTT